MDDHFYLTLSSNGQSEIKLSERIRLDDDFEVGLSEIGYPHNWYNVDNEDEKYWINVHELDDAAVIIHTVYVKSGYYKDGDAFASSLTQQVTRAFADVPKVDIKFTFVKHIDRIRMRINQSLKKTVAPSTELLEFLGFGPKLIFQPAINRTGSRPFDVKRGFRLLYVYCDVGAHSIVGDTKSPLLRVVNIEGRHGEFVRNVFAQPHYVPVGRREFGSVTITINNELGKPITLRSGQFVITLHFRRRRKQE